MADFYLLILICLKLLCSWDICVKTLFWKHLNCDIFKEAFWGWPIHAPSLPTPRPPLDRYHNPWLNLSPLLYCIHLANSLTRGHLSPWLCFHSFYSLIIWAWIPIKPLTTLLPSTLSLDPFSLAHGSILAPWFQASWTMCKRLLPPTCPILQNPYLNKWYLLLTLYTPTTPITGMG